MFESSSINFILFARTYCGAFFYLKRNRFSKPSKLCRKHKLRHSKFKRRKNFKPKFDTYYTQIF